MKIYNSLTRQKEEFVPLVEGRVGMYVCGPTVYGPTHLGHGRTYVNFDVVHRYLTFKGYNVKYIQNITDVGHLVGDGDEGEDKIQRQAVKENIDPYAIAYKYECQYFDTMSALNVLRPTISCRATAFIMEMQDMIQTLIDKGYAYVTPLGNVYFDVKADKDYGKLSNRTLDNTISGTRIEVADDKRSPEDFALWKHAEPEHLMKWRSPWGVGFPGWHIECSTMSKKFLGDTIDIHGGGMDNMFPHHESEIAQSECANGCQFVRFFMHNNMLTVNGTKMGKSLGNFITLEDIFKKYDPMVIRWFILSFHYRAPVDFNEKGLDLARDQYDKLNTAVAGLRATLKEDIYDDKSSRASLQTNSGLQDIYDEFVSAMDDDFNTTVAMSVVLKLTKTINKALIDVNDNSQRALSLMTNHDYLVGLDYLVRELCEKVLGFRFTSAVKDADEPQIPSEIKDLAEKRLSAKKSKDWATADSLRAEITAKGYTITDTKDGYTIEKN